MKERLANFKIHSSLKGAGVSNDKTEFNNYNRPWNTELV